MLQTASNVPADSLGLPTEHDIEPKSRLPSKRKRDTICGLGSFNKSFTIRPCPQSPYDKPYTLKPVRIVGRAQLPLSFLDTSTDEDFTNRLFSASIDILEKHNELHDKENQSPKILVARLETKRTLCAVERVQGRVYSICKLASWLKEKEVSELWDPESLDVYPKFPRLDHNVSLGSEWWQHAMVDTKPVEPSAKRARLTMLRPLQKPETTKPQPEMHTIGKNQQDVTAIDSRTTEFNAESVEVPSLPSPQEQLDGLVEQYLNAIYLSKTSLAYFAKGPIARMRNAFTSPEEGAPPTHELATFLRSMLLSHKAEEKKYRERLPEAIKLIPPGCFSDEEAADAITKPRKSKKKTKLSREGMYPQEVEVVKKWWTREMPNTEAYGEETIDKRIKRRLADLRVREALAQMILILEVIALEALSTYKPPPEEGANEESQAPGESQSKPKKRRKKLDDVNLLLDLLLDKLCIWQSVEQEGVLDFDTKLSRHDEGVNGADQKGGNDRLQSFCVEVIIPFYMNRLPEQARMVNKKLGGPTNASPPKRKAMKPPTTSRKSGEPKEREIKKPRRSLGRVATDTTGQTGQRRPTLSLNRSNTDSVIDGIKREGSEVPLSAIPFQRSPSNAARQSMSHLKLLKGREVDLKTTSAAAAAKLKQRRRVEEDLQEAITALKKPNRGLAAGSYADDVEKRNLGLLSKSKKPANPVRRIVKDVQVSATPRAVRRSKNVVDQTPIQHRNPFIRSREPGVPPSSDFCIPSSAARPQSFVPTTVEHSVTGRPLAAPGVAETPSKPPVTKSVFASGTTGQTIFATPSKRRALSPESPVGVDATPTKTIASSPPNHLSTTPRALFMTPAKNATTTPVSELPLPDSRNSARDPEEPSIYDALGWNDDDDFD